MTTPHPTDALPLPELPDYWRPMTHEDVCNQIHAARREGYELAMTTKTDLAYSLKCHAKTLRLAGRNDAMVEDIERAAKALAAPIHDPAVTTPREVLVGESPVDRIVEPAQEQPKCEEGRECEAPDVCKSVGGCMRD